MKVKVVKPVQVVHAGQRYTEGDITPDIPNELAKQWLAQGWVTEAKPPRHAKSAADDFGASGAGQLSTGRGG